MRVLVVYKTGEYEVSSIDVSKRFNFSNIDILTKLDSKTIITCFHYIGNKKSYFIKRFKIETNQLNKLFSFIDDSRGSKFIKSTNLLNPVFKFNYRFKNGEKKEKLINIIDFIDVKGWKAIGNKISNYLRMSGFDFYDNPNDKLISNSIINNDSDVDDNINVNNNNQSDELTLF